MWTYRHLAHQCEALRPFEVWDKEVRLIVERRRLLINYAVQETAGLKCPCVVIAPESISIAGQDPQMPLSPAPVPANGKGLKKGAQNTKIDCWTFIGQFLRKRTQKTQLYVEEIFSSLWGFQTYLGSRSVCLPTWQHDYRNLPSNDSMCVYCGAQCTQPTWQHFRETIYLISKCWCPWVPAKL